MEEGSSILEKILLVATVVLTLTLMSCELDTCTECYDITRTVYYPSFNIYTETICYEIDCD